MLQKEQARLYLTRDKEGDDPQRLTFPIFAADGSETTTDMLFADRVNIGDKLDLISSYWEPAKDGVCRVHAVWRVKDGKAALGGPPKQLLGMRLAENVAQACRAAFSSCFVRHYNAFRLAGNNQLPDSCRFRLVLLARSGMQSATSPSYPSDLVADCSRCVRSRQARSFSAVIRT